MKIAVISQQTLHPSYDEISELQYKYCLQKFIDRGIPTFRHIGSIDENKRRVKSLEGKFNGNYFYLEKDCHKLHLDCDDLLDKENEIDPRGYKTYYAFKYLLENVDFDILFTTNCTSFLDVNGILENIKTFRTKRLYTGAISGWDKHQLWFVISAFGFISRDLVEIIVANKELYLNFTTEASYVKNAFVYEDVCIGRVFKHLGVFKYNADDQPWFVRPPLIHRDKVNVEDLEKCDSCLTYRVEKDYLEAFTKLYSLYN